MPEDLFDILEEVLDAASDRRKKRDKKAKKRARRGEYEEPARQPGGLLGRITSLFQPVPPPEPARPEPSPEAELDAAYRQQLRLLDDVRRSIDEVAEARRRMEERAARNRQRMADFEAQARQHLIDGRDDLARVALERKRLGEAQAGEFERELASLDREHTQLLRAEARLEAKIEAFRTRRDVLHSQRASAEAQARISEAYGGLTEESSDVAYTIRRIETHTRELRSRGAAADQMLDEGLLEGVEDPRTRFDRQLALSEVDADLERLRRQLDDEAGRR
ncbi:MAG TPA: PspA/IM30 family protein [Thermomicrobiales bacterium]|nr:PspA/IM30 family protein [Thermomicrobiales bacterium]